MTENHSHAIGQVGFAIIPGLIPSAIISDLICRLDGIGSGSGIIRRRESLYGIRNLLSVLPEAGRLAAGDLIRSLVEPVLGPDAFIVRGLFFDKNPAANWNVAWHQDLAIAVKERIDVAGFGPWSVKAGIPHALAPAEVLDRMLAVRLHLDDCDENNGALRVMPGSHRNGRLSDDEIEAWERDGNPVTCAVAQGGVLVMRPLLLHASHSSVSPAHRRVIHLEFATGHLPGGLVWHRA